jgi:hypothetical protein
MTLDEIKAAVDQGQTVHWANAGYRVIKDSLGQYLIAHEGGHCIGLASEDDVLNGRPDQFAKAEGK